jgi:hypothetical protein
MDLTPLSTRDLTALVDSIFETVAETYGRDPTVADWLAIAEAVKARVGELAPSGALMALPVSTVRACSRFARA